MNIKTTAKKAAAKTGKAGKKTGSFLGEALVAVLEAQNEINPYRRLQTKYGVIQIQHLKELSRSELYQVLEAEGISYDYDLEGIGGAMAMLSELLGYCMPQDSPLASLRHESPGTVRNSLRNAGVYL